MNSLAKHHRWLYEDAKGWLASSLYANEVTWTNSLETDKITEEAFLREVAWVIFCSGFRESVVRKKFGLISLAFFDWSSAASIANDSVNCIRIARPHFSNVKKLQAVVSAAEMIREIGFLEFKDEILRDPLFVLQAFPFIGPITSLHLAKNLGFQFAKPDRHLEQLADSLGFASCDDMCAGFSSITGDSIAMVDTVLWRYCEQYARWPKRTSQLEN